MDITFNIALVPLALAVVQIVKQFFPEYEAGTTQRKIWDGVTFLTSIIVGIGLSWLVDDLVAKKLLLEGLLVGLTASGLYTGTKVGGTAIKASLS